MEWKINDSLPIWPQIREQLMFEIVAGRYRQGGPFPTVRELAEDAKVNRNTMQRALAELEADGLLITNRTAGRSVTTDDKLIAGIREELAKEKIERFMEEMESIGFCAEEIAGLIYGKHMGTASEKHDGVDPGKHTETDSEKNTDIKSR